MGFKDHSQDGKDAIQRATIKWLFEACMLVEGQAVALAPVQTARLRNSIDYVVDENELIGYVGSPVEYAVFVEFGENPVPNKNWAKSVKLFLITLINELGTGIIYLRGELIWNVIQKGNFKKVQISKT